MFWDPLPRADRPSSKGTLMVHFAKGGGSDGGWYWYRETQAEWDAWNRSRSLGKYYNRNVKGNF